jgi:hypothetical protein
VKKHQTFTVQTYFLKKHFPTHRKRFTKHRLKSLVIINVVGAQPRAVQVTTCPLETSIIITCTIVLSTLQKVAVAVNLGLSFVVASIDNEHSTLCQASYLGRSICTNLKQLWGNAIINELGFCYIYIYIYKTTPILKFDIDSWPFSKKYCNFILGIL